MGTTAAVVRRCHVTARAYRLGDQGVDGEGVRRKYRRCLRRQKCPRHQFEHIVGTVAERDATRFTPRRADSAARSAKPLPSG